MYAVKCTNLLVSPVKEHFSPAYSLSDACDKMRAEIAEMQDVGWELGVDFEAEVVEIDDDFDFDDQPCFN